jgi:hypothetical protein
MSAAAEAISRAVGTIHWIDADHTKAVVQEPADVPPDLQRMQDYVEGHIEVVHVMFKGKRTQMLVNEEGLITAKPFNMRATSLYHLASIQDRGEFPNSPIVGNAIVLEDLPLE